MTTARTREGGGEHIPVMLTKVPGRQALQDEAPVCVCTRGSEHRLQARVRFVIHTLPVLCHDASMRSEPRV